MRPLTQLEDSPATLPTTFEGVYAQILGNVEPEHQELVFRTLQFLVYSDRCLTLNEAIDMLAVDLMGHPCFDPENRIRQWPRICKYRLVKAVARKRRTLDNEHFETTEVQLEHPCLQDYLRSSRLPGHIANFFQETTARGNMAKVCLAYLSCLEREMAPSEIRDAFPFAQYCAENWMAHAAVAEEHDPDLRERIVDFFLKQPEAVSNCYRLYDPDLWQPESSAGAGPPKAPLYLASQGGLFFCARSLLEQGAKHNVASWILGFPLQAAAAHGHKQIVQLLLEWGADVNATGGLHNNALSVAIVQRQEHIVEYLLQNGADVHAEDRAFGNVLRLASWIGEEGIVKLLLAAGADANDPKEETDETALSLAASMGHEGVVRILLDGGADVNAHGRKLGSALCVATQYPDEQEKTAQMLLDAGADVDTEDRHSGTALSNAAHLGHENVVRMLLDAGADVNARGGPNHNTAIEVASAQGYENIVEMLLSQGANLEVPGERRASPQSQHSDTVL